MLRIARNWNFSFFIFLFTVIICYRYLFSIQASFFLLSKMKPATKRESFAVDIITMRSKSPHRTAESLKLGHAMTFAWHFCFGACSCFPCCLEYAFPLLYSDPNPTNPSKLRPNARDEYGPCSPDRLQALLSCCLCHTIWHFLFQSLVFINHLFLIVSYA